MKSILNTAAVVAVLAVSAVSAQAQVNSAEAGYGTDVTNAQSTKSRQQVINEYLAARKDGTLPLVGDSYTDPAADNHGAAVARSNVQRQAAGAAHAGTAIQGEGSVQ
ncbi:DUF4148 domain-containing protein [Diaphorobacter sp. HDW4B]|uniref:DUF4148 domain-containing protein n=1 Tax=Diaphorobacter sp. HDW4B TaxID=2714925 RepID=UPI0014086029|nr:DUF4148 domain-containing protein [Diaphorobacter sp. HDW4B]QIL71711.1 DUF4148 domain-containing protein [Diaphorobacter sp. HDW4B]